MPGEKQFVEVTTGETMVISNIGVFASRKDENKFVRLQFPEQILYTPFVQLQQRRNGMSSQAGGDGNYTTGKSGMQDGFSMNCTPL